MKITSYAVARPQYYDRNAVSTFFSYGATLGPHAPTQRWTTTVAAGKKLLVEQGEGFLLTVVAAAIPLRVLVQGTITDGTYLTSFIAVDIQQSANLSQCSTLVTYPGITVYAGETAYGTTYNGSATGTVAFFVGLKGTTFQS